VIKVGDSLRVALGGEGEGEIAVTLSTPAAPVSISHYVGGLE
jgi:hypothetical protein